MTSRAKSEAQPAKDRGEAEGLAALEAKLGHSFKDKDRLREALTHASVQDARGNAPVNERLEFLGDRVLGLLAAEALLERFPAAREGDLAPRLNALVRKESCASIASALGLGAYIRVAESEAKAKRALPTAILGDACEAVIAAIFLDGGLDAARRFFRSAWKDAIAEVDIVPRDAKSALQEWTQEKTLGLPSYELVERTGPDHAPEFTVRVGVAGIVPAEGKGASKRSAEQAAAAAFLVAQGIWSEAEAARAQGAS